MPQKMPQQSTGTSNDTKTLVTVLLLIFLYPIGVIVMFVWTKWKLWVKLLVAFPFVLILLAFMWLVLQVAINPGGNKGYQRAQCMNACLKTTNDNAACVQQCAAAEAAKNTEEKMMDEEIMISPSPAMAK